ncbi:MAG: hypothetical protein HQK94_17730 [Nitrospirae bacterium]|nr:hypothetical protein [Nitrospirota bacterium]
MMIKSGIFLSLIAIELIVIGFLYLDAKHTVAGRNTELQMKRALVKELSLTDFALFTEARYTRHPSQADTFSPFQDFPSSMDHFPAGSILAPSRRN